MSVHDDQKTIHALHKKWSFLLRISSVNVTKSQGTADLLTFTAEIINGKFQFLCSDGDQNLQQKFDTEVIIARDNIENALKNLVSSIFKWSL